MKKPKKVDKVEFEHFSTINDADAKPSCLGEFDESVCNAEICEFYQECSGCVIPSRS